ncbi:MAG: hypothetical protein M3O70_08165 [Actinomycetota bacterium]|nr:hypothetical protein [Actinomycetota bacterium]
MAESPTQKYIEQTLAMIERAEAQLAEQVYLLRRYGGESWADIGRRLGVSKQAAWERFHEQCEEWDRRNEAAS